MQQSREELVKKYGSLTKASKALKIPRTTLTKQLGGPASVAAPREGGRSLASFKQTYHKDTIVPGKIKAALSAMGASWEYESEFVKRAGVSFADLSLYRESFADFVIQVRQDNKRVWAGTKRFAAQLKEML
jgi:hypothetical protein